MSEIPVSAKRSTGVLATTKPVPALPSVSASTLAVPTETPKRKEPTPVLAKRKAVPVPPKKKSDSNPPPVDNAALDFDAKSLPDEWKLLFKSIDILPRDLKNPEILNSILDAIGKHQTVRKSKTFNLSPDEIIDQVEPDDSEDSADDLVIERRETVIVEPCATLRRFKAIKNPLNGILEDDFLEIIENKAVPSIPKSKSVPSAPRVDSALFAEGEGDLESANFLSEVQNATLKPTNLAKNEEKSGTRDDILAKIREGNYVLRPSADRKLNPRKETDSGSVSLASILVSAMNRRRTVIRRGRSSCLQTEDEDWEI